MASLGVLAITEDRRHILNDLKSAKWLGAPKKLATELDKGVSAITCCAIGTGGDFFCAWRNIAGEKLWLSELGNYPTLATYLAGEDRKRFDDEFHVSLGPNGSFYFNNPTVDFFEGRWYGNPAYVTLGCDGSYVLVGRDGDLLWDLKGNYPSLEKVLQEATTGVRNVILSPLHIDLYYLVLNDGREY
ncbi:hypothetical protein HD806DRAFT_526942 [Xylariaceae sp. AK1471]|nr:hypothetical protein HD806DRAFT_526942 [Xylariaceae sp. AK1471]